MDMTSFNPIGELVKPSEIQSRYSAKFGRPAAHLIHDGESLTLKEPVVFFEMDYVEGLEKIILNLERKKTEAEAEEILRLKNLLLKIQQAKEN